MFTFALAAFMMTATAVPAATTMAAPVITGFACDSAGATVSCYVTYAGGTPPVSIVWSWNGLVRSAWDNRTTVSGSCQVGFPVQVGVRIFDSTGEATAGRPARRAGGATRSPASTIGAC